jgi:hypothetical protein
MASPPPGWDKAPVVNTAPPPGWDAAKPVSAPAGSGDSTDALVKKYTAQYGVPEDFAQRIRGRESGGTKDPSTATSSAGARGIYQLMPGTFKDMGVGGDITNPEQNVHAGIKYLSQMLQRYHGDQTLAAAAYNAGPGAVDAAHGVPHIAETQAYAQATAAPQAPQGWDAAAKSSTTPPPGWDQAKPSQPVAPSLFSTAPPPAGNLLQQLHKSPMMKAVNKASIEGEKNVAWIGSHPIPAAGNILSFLARPAAGLETDGYMFTHNPLQTIGRALHDEMDVDAGNKDMAHVQGTIQEAIHGAVGHLTPSWIKPENVPHNDFLEFLASSVIQDPLSVFNPFGPAWSAAAKTAHATEFARMIGKGAATVGAKIPGLNQTVNAGTKSVKAYHAAVADTARRVFTGRPGLDPDLTTGGKNLRLGIEERNMNIMSEELGHSDRKLIKTATKDIRAATSGKPPELMRQRTLQEAWRYGQPENRVEATQHGYKPVPEDEPWKDAPEGLLHYPHGLRHDYEYTGDISKPMKESPAFQGREATYGTKTASFEYSRSKVEKLLEGDPVKRWEKRLKMGRDMVEKRRVDKETEAYLTKFGGWKGQEKVQAGVEDAIKAHKDAIGSLRSSAALFRADPEKGRAAVIRSLTQKLEELKAKKVMGSTDVENYAALQAKLKTAKSADPKKNAAYFADRAAKNEAQAAELEKGTPTAENLLPQMTQKYIHDMVMNMEHTPWQATGPGDVNLRFLSRMGAQGVKASGLPHLVGNEGSFFTWRGGIPAIVGGIRKMLPYAPGKSVGLFHTGISPELLHRMKMNGSYKDYDADFERMLVGRVPGIKQVLGFNNELLNRGELALRGALLESLDKEMGPSKSMYDEMQKSAIVRDTAGDTRNMSAFISVLEALGAPFAGFVGATLHNVGKTLRSEHAYRIALPIKTQQAMDKDKKDFHGLQMMNPALTAARMLGSGAFSESHSGPIPGAIGDFFMAIHGHPMFNSLEEQAMEAIRNYGGPGISQIPSIFSEPYAAPGKHPGDINISEAVLNYLTGWFHSQPHSDKGQKYINKAAMRAENR